MAVVGIYAYSIADVMWKQSGMLTRPEIILGTWLTILLLYFTWKVVGPALPIVAIVCIIYAFIGPYLPQIIGHRGYTWARIVEVLFKGTNGIFGTSLGASSIYVAIFCIFAAFLESSGAGDVFINLTQAKLGAYRGGPAKVAVVASGLFGTISGSAVANVVGTGTFTIPMMKRSGFRGEFAGAVEAAASSGGQIMPPVMGAAAFIMADMVGSYQAVIFAAIIPAVLYYVALYMMIDLEAIKRKLVGLPKSELPNFAEELKKGWYLLAPLVILILLLVVFRYSPQKSAFFSTCLLVAICLLHPSKREKVSVLVKNLAKASQGIPNVALTTATSGIIVGILMMTGLGYKLSSLLVEISGGNVFLLLLFTMCVSIVLGMGMPTSGAYILLATLIVPSLKEWGIPELAAHFFVFYFGVLANVTPPVAIASYTAAGIAKADTMRTGLEGLRLCLAGFLMPYMFCFNPVLLGDGSPVEIIMAIITATIGIFGLACSLHRFFLYKLSIFKTGLLLLGSLGMMMPGTLTDVIGIAIVGVILASQYLSRARHNGTPMAK